jgi:hypothetical protein
MPTIGRDERDLTSALERVVLQILKDVMVDTTTLEGTRKWGLTRSLTQSKTSHVNDR